MSRRDALSLLGMTVAGGVPSGAAPPRDRFVGVYKLVTYRRHAASGEVTDVYGTAPLGRISYDAAGRMWAFLSRPDRKPAKNPSTPTLEEYRHLNTSLVAYYGSFDVDEAAHHVIHHVEAATNPAWVGTDLVRKYEFSGRTLTLSVEGATRSVLVWERLPDG
jgi:hypothetical protein